MIYLDHNATTPLLHAVRAAMEPYLSTEWGNASSPHSVGRRARQAIEGAREKIAYAIGVAKAEVVFTSGATESNNTVIHSVLAARRDGGHIIATGTEHSSILAACNRVEPNLHPIRMIQVDPDGQVDWEELSGALPGAALLTTCWANNETGVIMDVQRMSDLCAKYSVPLHLDAAQAFGKIPVSLQSLDIAYLSLSGHKIGGPKGTGALVVSPAVPFTPLIVGGSQELSRRSGTENVASIVGFGAAAALVDENARDFVERIRPLRDVLESELAKIAPNSVHARNSIRLPNTFNIAFPVEDALELVIQLDQKGICVSAGSACHAGSLEPSHVLLAMGIPRETAQRSVRFSLGLTTTRRDIDSTAQVIQELLAEQVARNGSA